MGTKLTGSEFAHIAVVGLTREVGTTFKGRLLVPGREVKLKRGKGMVYEFAAIDTDMQTQIRIDKDYVDHPLSENERVAIFAPSVLHNALLKAAVGDVITIKYLGKETSDRGNEYHNFDVEKE